MLGNHLKNKKMKEKTTSGQQGLSVTFIYLAVTFCVCLIISNIFEPRLWKVWGLPMQLTGGVVLFPVSYIINDCITEVYGYKKARLVIWMGFSLNLFVALASFLVCSLPSPLYPDNQPLADAFNTLFHFVPRTTFASLTAFLVGSTMNAWVMSKMKVASHGKGFSLRAILSSVAGELADSVIFFPIAFWGILSWRAMIGLMITQIVAKTLYEVIILPVTRRIVIILKRREEMDTFDEGISYNPFKISDI